MFNFLSSFKSDVKTVVADLHERLVTLETKVEALMHFASAKQAAETVPAANDVAAPVENTDATQEGK